MGGERAVSSKQWVVIKVSQSMQCVGVDLLVFSLCHIHKSIALQCERLVLERRC